MFITNLAARNQALKSEVLREVQVMYPQLLIIPVPEDINEVIVGLPQTDSARIPSPNPDLHEGLSDVRSCYEEIFSPGVRKNVTTLAKLVAAASKEKRTEEDLEKEWSTFLKTAVQYNPG